MRYVYIALGSVFTVLGIIGVFLPLLPTTPFLLLAATLYLRSSNKLYVWLLNQPLLGPYIRNFMEHRAIPLHAKIIAVGLLWVTMLYCIHFAVSALWLKLLLSLLAVGITVYILSFKTLRKTKD